MFAIFKELVCDTNQELPPIYYRFYVDAGPMRRRVYLQHMYPWGDGWFYSARLDITACDHLPACGRAMSTAAMKQEFPEIYDRFAHILEAPADAADH